MMDEIHEQLHQTAANAPSPTDNLKQRYFPEYIQEKSNNLEIKKSAGVLLDESRIQQQISRFQLSIRHVFGSSQNLSQINLLPQNYTFAIDRFLTEWQNHSLKEIGLYPFTPLSGSDERQYCSALMNLPVVSVFRTMYGVENYPFYHTQSDSQEYFSLDSIADSALKIFDILYVYGLRDQALIAQYIGEPQLGKYQLYPEVNEFSSNITRVRATRRNINSASLLTNILFILNLSIYN